MNFHDVDYFMGSRADHIGESIEEKGYKSIPERVELLVLHDILFSVENINHFYMGDAARVNDIVNSSTTGEELFSNSGITAQFLPYEWCWFEFYRILENGNKMDVGILTKCIDGKKDLFIAYFFYRILQKGKKKTQFIMSDDACLVSVGNSIRSQWDVIENAEEGYGVRALLTGNGHLKDFIGDSSIMLLKIHNLSDLQEVNFWQQDFFYSALSDLNEFLIVLNCKNSRTSIVTPPRALNRKRAKRGKEPINEYKVLSLDLSNKMSLNFHGDQTKGEWANRHHFCRGHFKDYSGDSKLFGKYNGLFWWQPHARGAKHLGTITKDYKIKP